MRRSTRLKALEGLEKLKSEEFLNLDAGDNDNENEYEYDSDDEMETEIAAPAKKANGKRRGRPKKSAAKYEEGQSDGENFNEDEEILANYSESESEPESVASEKPSATRSPKKQTKKKLKRAGGYIPPLETNPKDFMGKVMSSRNEWHQFLRDQSNQIKRKNRRYKTFMMEPGNESNFLPVFSSFNKSKIMKTKKAPLKLMIKENIHDLIDESISFDGKVSFYSTGSPISSLCFCKCNQCTGITSIVIIFVQLLDSIEVISVELSNNDGIKSMNTISHILPPQSEFSKTICSHGSALSISTNRGLYFLNCDLFHQDKVPNNIALLESKNFKNLSEISCHSWKGNNVAVGTLSGRLHIFNSENWTEIFQQSILSNSAIYSLDWKDEYTILIGGSFPKIFSIDLRDPFIVETEVSTLATLSKVVWSQSLNSILFADGENHARRLEKSTSTNGNRLHQPIGTFSSMVLDMKTSPLHNIIASVSASGSIHLSWIPEEVGYGVEFEKKILSVQKSEEETCYQVKIEPEYVQYQITDTIKLYPNDQACTAVNWCPNENFPGLLSAGYRNGLLVLMATDQFFI